MALWLDINPRSGVPLYVQIVQQIKHALEVGALQPGDQLPTVRQLAGELTIAPNTIVKAYNELQAMNLIESRAGVGTIVLPQANGAIRVDQISTLFERLSEITRDAALLGIKEEELRAHFEVEIERFFKLERD